MKINIDTKVLTVTAC